jgi:dipeptidyl aminopeptidase/acylaminoacyl peptidase
MSFLLLACCPALLGAEEKPRTHDITVDDYFSLDIIMQHQAQAFGDQVAYTVSRWDKASDGRRVDLWTLRIPDKPPKPRRLTFDHTAVLNPHWSSSDTKMIYFMGRLKREGEKQPPLDGSTQVWRVNSDGGEPVAVTRVPGGVEAFDLSTCESADVLYYQTSAEKVAGSFAALKKEFKSIDYGHGVGKTSQLWRLNLESWKSEKVVDEGRVIREFKVSPDRESIAMITTPDETVVSFEGKSRVDVFNLKTKKNDTIPDKCFRAEARSPYGWLEHLAWGSMGGRPLAFNVVFDGYPAEIIVARLEKDAWVASRFQRTRDHVRGYGSPLMWVENSKALAFLMESKGRVRLYLATDAEKGEPTGFETYTPGDVVVESFSGGFANVVLMNDQSHTPDLYLVSRNQKPKRLTNVNPQVDTWKLPQISIFEWKNKDGDSVEGILELPPDYKKGDRLPLVVCIHGGPTTADRFHLQYWIYGRTLLPAKGYAVLCPNYRGSTGYEDKFLTDLIGHENELEVGDILSGVDALVAKGIADPDRLGVSGWSNGGYLTNCLITKTTRFKAASSGAGIVDTVMEWGGNDEPAYAIAFKKGFPWNQADLYKKTSPTYALDRVRTPTLIHVGGNDERCPPAQSRMLYRALKEYVKVPTELLVYPGESHGVMKYSHRKAKMEWDLAWFDKYILGKK